MERGLKLEIFLKKSQLRKQVWTRLDKAKTATELAKELVKHRSAISRVLLDLEKAGFVKCVNPEDKSFRHYVRKN
ncbi:MAG: helix-turn-helix domain-containing protein [Candidatus Pacearchaeota archaeon]|jgi:predicted transcriptional regulator